MVVSGFSGVNRRFAAASAAALVLLVALAAGAAPASAAAEEGGKASRYRGEILGVNRDEGSFTLRNVTSEGKELIVFHVQPGTEFTNAKDGSRMSFADLAAGCRAVVRARREGGRRLALAVEVRVPEKKRD